jgi:endonuclease/exonuclease/phosphatase family metal-dependent hydrolase
MNVSTQFPYNRVIWRVLCLATFLAVADLRAESVRVTTWNCASLAGNSTNEASTKAGEIQLQDAAAAIKKLNPDVILLQQINDWQSCEKLAGYLKPEIYRVVTCSAFKATATSRQVGILAKTRALISWSEAWKSESAPAPAGGFAFAVLHLKNKNVGLFSVQIGSGEPAAGGEVSVKQLLHQIDSFSGWTANRADALVIAGDFNVHAGGPPADQKKALQILEASGFARALMDDPQKSGAGQPLVTTDYLMVQNTGIGQVSPIAANGLAGHNPLTCDLDLNPAKPVVAQNVPHESVKAGTEAIPPAQGQRSTTSAPTVAMVAGLSNRWWWVAGGSLCMCVLVFMLWRLLRPRHAVMTMALADVDSGRRMNLLYPAGPARISVSAQAVTTSGSVLAGAQAAQVEVVPEQDRPRNWEQRAIEAEQRAEQARAMMRAGVMAQLTQWLKEKLVQKLIAQRTGLLETQEAATLKALAVDERLAKIEFQIKQSNELYERRIEELTRELAVAKEENRELIRAKIALIKAEMEAARTKMAQGSTTGQSK